MKKIKRVNFNILQKYYKSFKILKNCNISFYKLKIALVDSKKKLKKILDVRLTIYYLNIKNKSKTKNQLY